MRHITPLIAVLAFAAVSATPAVAQEEAQEVSLTGCLAEESHEDETVYVLTHVDSDAVDVQKVALRAGEGVNLAPHVGHKVEATGAVAAMESHGEMGEEKSGMHALKVTNLGHIAATCPEDDGR